MTSRSQFGQDIQALFGVYKGKKDGYFIEIGAYDGIESSNTYMMEKEFNWKGICVECSPNSYNLLVKNRNCITLPYAVYKEDDKEMEFYESGGYAGLVETNNHLHIVNDRKIIVHTKKLLSILEESNAPSFIEYLSLDTEGSEYDILNSHNFNKYIFGYICVQHNNIEKNRILIRRLLESKGYRFCKVNGDSTCGEVDDEYIHCLVDPLIKTVVPFINSSIKECGVYQYGIRLFNILNKSTDIKYIYTEVNSLKDYNDFISILNDNKCKILIYNYHKYIMNWLNKNTIKKISDYTKNIGIMHESESDMFDEYLSINPSDNYGIPRPLYNNIDSLIINPSPQVKEFIEFSKPGVPIFDSFGFGFTNKGFDKIVKIVNEQYDEAIIKFVMPLAAFDSSSEMNRQYVREACEKYNIKSNITLMITHMFFSNEDILLFLKSNTINLFLYDTLYGRSISSVIDYALSVNIPIGISDSYMFRNIYDDSICVYKNSIQDCIKNSQTHLIKYKNEWSDTSVIDFFKNIVNILEG